MPNPNKAQIFTPFTKVEDLADGTVNVYGAASDETLDGDGQISDLNWFREASKRWNEWGNIREMHQASAVGTSVELVDTGAAIELMSHIIDPVAVLKVKEGVYKGYSWGGKSVPGNPMKIVKDAAAPNGRIVGGEIVEISLVDRPANPSATFSIVKMAAADDDTNDDDGDEEKEPKDSKKSLDDVLNTITSTTTEDELTSAMGLIETSVKAASEPALKALYSGIVKVMPSLTETTMGAAATSPLCNCPETSDCQPNCPGGCACGKAMEAEVEKTQIAEIIKGLTPEERTELGIVPNEEFEALKAMVAEMGKRVQVGGASLAPAIPVLTQATTNVELNAEKALMEEMAKSTDPQTRNFASLKLDEIKKAETATVTK